jgi:protein-tyrosine-phosphatase
VRAALEGLMAADSPAPQAVLFACGLNAIRSPMAAALFKHFYGGKAYVGSAGVRKGELDPFAVAAMEELGLDISKHRPMTFEELEDWEGLNFDLIVTLSPEAHHKALELTRTLAADVEYWATPDPSDTGGNREQQLEGYRAVRDMLMKRIRERFSRAARGNE